MHAPGQSCSATGGERDGADARNTGHQNAAARRQRSHVLVYRCLKTPVVGLPIVNHDNNQHGANENLRLQNLWDGIEVFAGILAAAEKNWK
jgi:hypothetical protein